MHKHNGTCCITVAFEWRVYENEKNHKLLCNGNVMMILTRHYWDVMLSSTMTMFCHILLKGAQPAGKSLKIQGSTKSSMSLVCCGRFRKKYLKLQKNLYAVYIVSAVPQSKKSGAKCPVKDCCNKEDHQTYLCCRLCWNTTFWAVFVAKLWRSTSA